MIPLSHFGLDATPARAGVIRCANRASINVRNKSTQIVDFQRKTGRFFVPRLRATIDILGNRTTFLYDSRGRRMATLDPFGHAVTTVHDDRGRIAAAINQLGDATTFTL